MAKKITDEERILAFAQNQPVATVESTIRFMASIVKSRKASDPKTESVGHQQSPAAGRRAGRSPRKADADAQKQEPDKASQPAEPKPEPSAQPGESLKFNSLT